MNVITRYAATAVASGVAVASFAGTAAASTAGSSTASAPAATAPAAVAAGYLARNLAGKHHDHYTVVYGTKTYSDDGETADAVLSMDGAGVAQKYAAKATAWLESDVANYAIGAPTDYPGGTAKLLLVAEAQGVNPRKFGGLNLIAALGKSEGAGGASAGEYQQNPGFSGSSYVVSQALPVLALAALPHAKPDAAAVSFLRRQQCTDGGYQTTIRTKPSSTTCKDEDSDDTSYAVQALEAAGATKAAKAGLAYLAKTEHGNDSFGQPANANSTALAIEALIAGHKSVTKPERWLAGQQVRCGGAVARRGAVKYEAKFDSSALRATSQAGLALAGKTLITASAKHASKSAPVLACSAK